MAEKQRTILLYDSGYDLPERGHLVFGGTEADVRRSEIEPLVRAQIFKLILSPERRLIVVRPGNLSSVFRAIIPEDFPFEFRSYRELPSLESQGVLEQISIESMIALEKYLHPLGREPEKRGFFQTLKEWLTGRRADERHISE